MIRHRLQVRFRDCDPLGHVNNAVYLTYLEQARFNLWREQKLKKYQVTTPATFEPGWDELRAYAQQLSDQARAGGY